MQVADRWHLLKNAGEVLERVVMCHRGALTQAVADMVPPRGEPLPVALQPGPALADDVSLPQAAGRAARRIHLLGLYERTRELHAQGMSARAISKTLGLSSPTVRKYVRSDGFPDRAPRRTKIGAFSEHDAYLRQRWAQGCRDAVTVWHELGARGFRGTLRTVQRHVASLAPRRAAASSRSP